MTRTRAKYLILLPMIFILTGCWNYQDINEKSISISVGLDLVDGKIEFDNEIIKLQKKIAKETDKPESTDVYWFPSYGDTYEEARNNYDSEIPFTDFSGAMRAIIFSRDFAKEGIDSYTWRINNIYGFRKSLIFVISREQPRELLQKQVENDSSVGFAIEDTLTQQKGNGTAIIVTLKDILSDITFGKLGSVIPYIGHEKNTIKLLGYGILKDSKLVDIIDLENAKGVTAFLADKPIFIFTIPGPNNNEALQSFRLSLKKRKIRTSLIDNNVNIDVQLNFKAELQYQYEISPLSKDDIKALEEKLSEKLTNDIMKTVIRTQKEDKCDIFQFARYFRGQNPKEFKQIDWEKEYPEAKINIDVQVKLANTFMFDPNAKKQ